MVVGLPENQGEGQGGVQALNAWEDNRLLTSGVVKLKQVR